MSFLRMASRLQGDVPGIAREQARLALGDALTKIYQDRSWSFQTAYAGWLAGKVLLSNGTFTVAQYNNQVIADATATALIAGLIGRPFITELQYRDPQRSPYNIVAIDYTTNAPFATLTLDRFWMEPTSGPGQPYMIYQCYFPAPAINFRGFQEIRDTTDAARINFWGKSQADLARDDPQRLTFGTPGYCVEWGPDLRPGSSTYGFRLYELWPQQLSLVPYSFSYEYDGPMLVNPTDTVPYPLTEELLLWRAKEDLYDYAEANKDPKAERGAGANFQYLAQRAHSQYEEILEKITAVDANLRNDLLIQTDSLAGAWGQDAYSTRTGGLNVGGYNPN